MGKSRKSRNYLQIVTLVLLLLLGCSIAVLLLLKISEDNKEIESMQEQIDDMSDSLEDMSDTIEELQASVENHESLLAEDAAAAEEVDIEKAEPEVEKIDMLTAAPGTIIEDAKVNKEDLTPYFCAYPIPEDIFQRINGNSYVENSYIGLSELRYMKVLHYNFDHQIQVGELIVNAELESDFINIFRELFEAEYEIEKMHLIDNYWTGEGESSDTASIDDNNTSAFCFRLITGGTTISNHGLGRAIDINPQQNPYVDYSSGSPYWYHENANDYIARDTGYEHVITHDDICYKIFTKYGFAWGGDWGTIKDYQHFEKP